MRGLIIALSLKLAVTFKWRRIVCQFADATQVQQKSDE
jgi:hypothetical protein